MRERGCHPPRLRLSSWVHSRWFWLNYLDGLLRTPENYPPKTTENSVGMTPSGAAPPHSKLRVCEMGDVHTTYSGAEPSRMKSQGHPQASYTHSRDSIAVPIRSWWLVLLQSFFHASMQSFIGSSSHELQPPLSSVTRLCVTARVSPPFLSRSRFRMHSDHSIP